jgi:Zn-dependent M28 family amino/carboxypeptidase
LDKALSIALLRRVGVSLLMLFFHASTSWAQQFGDIPMDLLEKNLREHVRLLSSEIGERNMEKYENLQAAADYIETILKQYGYVVEFQTYRVGGREVRNLIATLPGSRSPKQTILVGAHYDTVPGSPGADDNASGVSGILELARLFSGDSTSKTIKWVAFVNEEAPYFLRGQMGSQLYARKAKVAGERIVAMISLEMIGYYTDHVHSQVYPVGLHFFYPNTGNFIGVVGHARFLGVYKRVRDALKKYSSVPVESLAGLGWIRGVDLSDHASFWREGYPAVMITDTAFYRNPNYHAPSDTFETLDYKRMAEVVKGLYHVLISLDH